MNDIIREQQDNEQRQAAREQREAYIARVGYDAGVMDRVNAPIQLKETEQTGRDVVQTVFPLIDVVKHENRVSRFAYDAVIIAPPVARYKSDTRAEQAVRMSACLTQASGNLTEAKKLYDRRDTSWDATDHNKSNPYLDGRLPKRDDEIANDIVARCDIHGRPIRNSKTQKVVYKSNGSPKRKQLGSPTCEALFTRGEKDTDGFSRTIALRYLMKRMVFSQRSNAKGKEDAPRTLKNRKTSSSKHKTPLYVSSYIEDIVQDAYILYQEGRKQTGEKKYNTGNRLHDTCDACRDARRNAIRALRKECKRIDILKARLKTHEDKARGIEARYDNWLDGKSELAELMDAVRKHGISNAAELAKLLGTYPMDISRRFARIRANADRERVS